MNRPRHRTVPSTVTVMQHPVHPMVVVFPIAFLVSALPSDLVFVLTGNPFWATASFWLLAGGLAVGLVAAVIGLVDFVTIREVRRHVAAWSHMLTAVTLLAVAALNVQLRWHDPAGAVLPWGVLVSTIGAVLVGVAAWLGGTLTFRHSIGNYSKPEDDDAD